MDTYMGEGTYPRYGTHTVELSLQWGKYKGTMTREMGGNLIGGRIIASAIEDLEMDANLTEIVLTNADGDELVVDDPDDFAELVVGARIIKFEEEKAHATPAAG